MSKLLSWFFRLCVLAPLREIPEPAPRPYVTRDSLAESRRRPKRIRVKRGNSILRRYRPQSWPQACYQFALEHDGLHARPRIGGRPILAAGRLVARSESGKRRRFAGTRTLKCFKISNRTKAGSQVPGDDQASDLKTGPKTTVAAASGLPVPNDGQDFRVEVDGLRLYRPIRYDA